MSEETFVCDRCGGTFPKHDDGWTEEKALAEKESYFPGVDLSECAQVCDDCWATIHPQRN